MQLTQDKLDELSHFSLRLAHWSEENWKAKDFAFFSDVELIPSIDAFSSVGFSAPFSPERSDFRQAFRPLAYSPVSVLLGGHQLQRTGRIVDVETELPTRAGQCPPAPEAEAEASPASAEPQDAHREHSTAPVGA